MWIALAFFGLGLIFGFVSLALGPLGLIEALIVLALILVQVRRLPERTGAYLIGASVLPLVILTSVVTRLPACGAAATVNRRCYAPITEPAIAAYLAAGLAGAVLLVLALRRLFRPDSPAS